MVSLDIHPTLSALARGTIPADRDFDGVDLMPFLQGERSEAPHEALFRRNGTYKAIRQGNWRLFWNQRDTWLFDLNKDLGEAANLAGENLEKVEDLKSIYSEWESGTAEPAWPARPGSRTVEVDGVLIDINI